MISQSLLYFAFHWGLDCYGDFGLTRVFFPFRKDKFPFGINRMQIHHNSTLVLVMIPPGGFFSLERKNNMVDVEKKFSYGYTLTYGIFKKFNKYNVACNESINFLEDKCKLNQVKYKIQHYQLYNNIPYYSLS